MHYSPYGIFPSAFAGFNSKYFCRTGFFVLWCMFYKGTFVFSLRRLFPHLFVEMAYTVLSWPATNYACSGRQYVHLFGSGVPLSQFY